jgi:hypothetical protein
MNLKKILSTIFLLLSIFSFGQSKEVSGDYYETVELLVETNYTNCADWKKAVNDGDYEAPDGWTDLKCYKLKKGEVVIDGLVKKFKLHNEMSKNHAGMRAVKVKIENSFKSRLLVSNLDNLKYYEEPKYNTCKVFWLGVDSGDYELPQGWNKKNTNCSVSNGVLIVSNN